MIWTAKKLHKTFDYTIRIYIFRWIYRIDDTVIATFALKYPNAFSKILTKHKEEICPDACHFCHLSTALDTFLFERNTQVKINWHFLMHQWSYCSEQVHNPSLLLIPFDDEYTFKIENACVFHSIILFDKLLIFRIDIGRWTITLLSYEFLIFILQSTLWLLLRCKCAALVENCPLSWWISHMKRRDVKVVRASAKQLTKDKKNGESIKRMESTVFSFLSIAYI